MLTLCVDKETLGRGEEDTPPILPPPSPSSPFQLLVCLS